MERFGSFDKACGTSVDTSHRERYGAYIDFLGRKEVEDCIPFSEEEVAQALESGDKHLNSLNIKEWNRAAGFVENSRTGAISRFNTKLTALARSKVSGAAPSQLVCVLKEAATARYERERGMEVEL